MHDTHLWLLVNPLETMVTSIIFAPLAKAQLPCVGGMYAPADLLGPPTNQHRKTARGSVFLCVPNGKIPMGTTLIALNTNKSCHSHRDLLSVVNCFLHCHEEIDSRAAILVRICVETSGSCLTNKIIESGLYI
jgi:hypothetical protein